MAVKKRSSEHTAAPLETKKPRAPSSTAEETISPKKTLYVNNLNDKIKVQTLRENLYLLFSTYGEVLQINVSNKNRGQAFIVLRTPDEANVAMISLQKETFFEKELHIQFSRQDSKLVASDSPAR
ncbi:U2 snRNP complex subunit MSL1 [Lachancea thermotolerans CBS 6340]|uniref:KLTH0F13816p n=1 Tax=Lachancea thermotolerans (strain ATCC 56472 / CBS 6340 / NRRL Y-8284) TaxID=559295 RepID=C5DJ62_LACTC|nr:KLTH0F13816p [Lachancea thermotolerans CBS 6340]CAR24351.1 KLTH0F13816p [Lachancea thermotolerans CBS 6340]